MKSRRRLIDDTQAFLGCHQIKVARIQRDFLLAPDVCEFTTAGVDIGVSDAHAQFTLVAALEQLLHAEHAIHLLLAQVATIAALARIKLAGGSKDTGIGYGGGGQAVCFGAIYQTPPKLHLTVTLGKKNLRLAQGESPQVGA